MNGGPTVLGRNGGTSYFLFPPTIAPIPSVPVNPLSPDAIICKIQHRSLIREREHHDARTCTEFLIFHFFSSLTCSFSYSHHNSIYFIQHKPYNHLAVVRSQSLSP